MKLHRRSKNNKKPILRQVLDLIPAYVLRKSVYKFQTDKGCHNCAVQVREMGIENETSLATRQVNKPVR